MNQTVEDAKTLMAAAKLIRDYGYNHSAQLVLQIAEEIVEDPSEPDTAAGVEDTITSATE